MTITINPPTNPADLKPRLDWHWHGNDYRIGYAETDDPRVLAVIERDDDTTLGQAFEGDAINPIYTRDFRMSRLDHVGGYDDDTVADAWTRAFSHHWDVDFADRYVRVFHGAEVYHTRGGYRPDFEVLIFDTPAYREHIGDTADNVTEPTDMASEVLHVLEGEVFGVGYAVMPERTTTETPVDFDWFDHEIECWGYIGEAYAQREAESYAQHYIANLHPLLPGT